MPTDSHERLDSLALSILREVDALRGVLPLVLAVQWDRSLAGMGPRDLTGIRSKAGHADPTADTALDSNRLYLRTVLRRCEPRLLAALVAVRGVRRGLEMALERWEGPDTSQEEPEE